MAVCHTVIRDYKSAWQKVSRFDLAGALPLYEGQAFLINYVSIIALQAWRYLLRVANSGLKSDGFIYLAVELVQRVFGAHKILPARQCNGSLFHLLADFLYFYICFGRRCQLNRLPSSGDVNIKLLFAMQIGLYWLMPPLSIGAETAVEKIYLSTMIRPCLKHGNTPGIMRQILQSDENFEERFMDEKRVRIAAPYRSSSYCNWREIQNTPLYLLITTTYCAIVGL